MGKFVLDSKVAHIKLNSVCTFRSDHIDYVIYSQQCCNDSFVILLTVCSYAETDTVERERGMRINK